MEVQQHKMKLLSKIQEEYEQMWKSIIRPTRNCYPLTHLGPQKFHLQDVTVIRHDFELTNNRGYVFFCSLFTPSDSPSFPCVVFSHGNSSNRTEGMEYLGKVIRSGLALCTFDFSGCGNAEGDFVTLGYYEQHDLGLVVNYLRQKQQITWVALWGRSMGAVASLLYLHTYEEPPFIKALVLDSPFKSLKALIEDIVKKNSKVPMFIVSGALKIIASTIQEKALFDIYKINCIKNDVPHLLTPVMFIVGKDDELIPPTHTTDLYSAYAGTRKQCVLVKGKHNDCRSDQCVEDALKFILKAAITDQPSNDQQPTNPHQTLVKDNHSSHPHFPHQHQFSFFRTISTAFGSLPKTIDDPYEETRKIIRENIQHLQSKKIEKSQNKLRNKKEREQDQANEDDSLAQIKFNIKNWSY